MLIDWPNLIAGFLLGIAGTIPFWLVDRRHARREIEAEWTRAALRIEKLLWQPSTRGADLVALTDEMPLDHWRGQFGPRDFRVLENVQTAYWTVEHAATDHAEAAATFYHSRGREYPHPDINAMAFMRRVEPERFLESPVAERYAEAIDELQTDPAYHAAEVRLEQANRSLEVAKVTFMNLARARSRDEYTEVVRREGARFIMRHPLRATRAALRSRRAKRLHSRRAS